ncbi:MAG TPA: hypothetical protein VI670_09670 [Thermoanaerobaculia bacterium]|jgi:hypothetical protein
MTPEDVIAHLRAISSEIDDVTPLTQEQRARLKQRLRRHPAFIVDASINVIGVLDNVWQTIGQPLDEVRKMQDDTLRWDAAIDEARAFLRGIEGANLVRRQQLALIGMQAYAIGTQLAKNPAKAMLVPQVEEIKRLKGAARRRRATARPAQMPDPADHPQRSD